MAKIIFPIVNNKEIEYPLKPDMKTVFPTYYSGDSLKVAAYSSVGNDDPIKVADGWTNDGRNTVWIGKDVESLTFKHIDNVQSARHEIASIAFEDGRTDLSNIFFMGYHMDGNEEVDDEEHKEEFSDMSALPFRINTSVRLPKEMTDFPGITLEAPYNYQGNEWSCDVVLGNPYFTGFVIHGGSATGIAENSGEIRINDGDNKFFSLDSENGTVNIYFPNITLDTLNEHSSNSTVFVNGITKNSLHCNLKFFLADEVYEDLKSHESWTDSEANGAGYYKLETQKMTALEAKVKDVIANEDTPEVTPSDIELMFRAPLIDILEISGQSGTPSSYPNYIGLIEGKLSVTDTSTYDVKYVDFSYDGGTITAYLMDDLRDPNPGTDLNVSSEITIDPLYELENTPYIPTVSFRGGVDAKPCSINYVK